MTAHDLVVLSAYTVLIYGIGFARGWMAQRVSETKP